MAIRSGFIKLDKKILEWGWYRNSNTFRLFVHLLLRANFKPTKYETLSLLPGQLVIGRKVLAEELGLSEQQIRTSLSNLQTTKEITIKSTNKFSIVTICNWADYQGNKRTNQPTNQPTKTLLSNQQITTLEEVKKKEYNININFDEFRKAFPGTKRGLGTEIENFLKKNNEETIKLLLPALEREKQYRAKCTALKQFVPPWKNLSTWINSKSWETEYTETSQINPKNQLNLTTQW
jgi:hypothetical protein